jgi:hypothetical protein
MAKRIEPFERARVALAATRRFLHTS